MALEPLAEQAVPLGVPVAGELGPALRIEVVARDLRSPEVRAIEHGAVQHCPGEVGPLQVRASEPCTAQIRELEVGPGEVRSREVVTTQSILILEAEVGEGEVCGCEVSIDELDLRSLDLAQRCPR